MYQLYYDKETSYAEVKPAEEIYKKIGLSITNTVKHYKNKYYFCKNESTLIHFAEKLKEIWLQESK